MTQLLNGAAVAEMKPDPLVSLAGRLTEPQDRETYAALISYIHSLPPGDEFRRLAELLGFLSLLGQRIPDALRESVETFRQQSQSTALYHQKLDARLARLPAEIAEGVDPEELAEAMSESFRQQIAATGLDDTARLLSASVAGLRTVSAELATSVRPLTNQYAGIGTVISAELTRLTNASAQLRQHNADLIVQAAEERWLVKGLLAVALLVIGAVSGILYEKRTTTELLRDMGSELQRIQTPTVPAPASTMRNKKQ
ncbi:MAG TPA: hypothetical protein VK513_04610 [Terriglobales bacterium]|nr:hypothetical protein [Terriglobales bacterium]